MAVEERQFELQRGVSEVEVRHGFAQAHVCLKGDLASARIAILEALAEAGVSHKYLKLTQDGLAFIITESQVADTREVLDKAGVEYELNSGRSLVMVHAIGMREEPGMLATILEAAVASGVSADHIGDMHDKMFMVVRGELAEDAAARFRDVLMGTQRL